LNASIVMNRSSKLYVEALQFVMVKITVIKTSEFTYTRF